MAELEKELDFELKRMKLEKTYLAMTKAGIIPELNDFLKTLSSEE